MRSLTPRNLVGLAVLCLCPGGLGLSQTGMGQPARISESAQRTLSPDHVPWTISLRGAGPVRFGMSLAEVRRVLGDPKASLFVTYPGNSRGENGCSVLLSKALPDGLGLMFFDQKVFRVDVSERTAGKTDLGGRVGDFEERIQALYAGHIRVEPDPQDPNGHYLIYQPGDARDKDYELLFESDGHDVTNFRSGFATAVALANGCG